MEPRVRLFEIEADPVVAHLVDGTTLSAKNAWLLNPGVFFRSSTVNTTISQ